MKRSSSRILSSLVSTAGEEDFPTDIKFCGRCWWLSWVNSWSSIRTLSQQISTIIRRFSLAICFHWTRKTIRHMLFIWLESWHVYHTNKTSMAVLKGIATKWHKNSDCDLNFSFQGHHLKKIRIINFHIWYSYIFMHFLWTFH